LALAPPPDGWADRFYMPIRAAFQVQTVVSQRRRLSESAQQDDSSADETPVVGSRPAPNVQPVARVVKGL
jgi:hypothetical protein